MPPALPPYALVAPVFRFRALASLAARAPLGGPRELALACYLGARLVLPLAHGGAGPLLDDDIRAARASGARAWLASVALPAPTRTPMAKLYDTTARPLTPAETARPARKPRTSGSVRVAARQETTHGSRAELTAEVSSALASVMAAAEHWLDAAARQELTQLQRELDTVRG